MHVFLSVMVSDLKYSVAKKKLIVKKKAVSAFYISLGFVLKTKNYVQFYKCILTSLVWLSCSDLHFKCKEL